MGICVVCFERDIAGALGLYRAAAVQYIRPSRQNVRRTSERIACQVTVEDVDGEIKLVLSKVERQAWVPGTV